MLDPAIARRALDLLIRYGAIRGVAGNGEVPVPGARQPVFAAVTR
jgi:hypothetical protein